MQGYGYALIYVVIGWAVLAGHTKVSDPHANFREAFANSSHSGNDVRGLITNKSSAN